MKQKKVYAPEEEPVWAQKGRYVPLIATYEAGAPWKNTDISLCWVNFDYQHFHKHQIYELFLLVKGELIHSVNGKEYKLSEGSACLVRPNDVHQIRNSNSANKPQQLFFFIKDEFMTELLNMYDPDLCEQLLNSKEPLHFKLNNNELETIVNGARQIPIYDPEKLAHNVFQTKILFHKLLHILFDQVLRQEAAYPDWLIQLLNHVNNPEVNYTLEEILTLTNYSYSRFASLFKKYVGIPFKQYVVKVKMEYAKELLKNSDLTTLQITSVLGYDSLSYFNHAFKQTYGYTPTAYRKRVKGTPPPEC